MNQLLSLAQSAGEAAGSFTDKVEKCPHLVKSGHRNGGLHLQGMRQDLRLNGWHHPALVSPVQGCMAGRHLFIPF